MPLTLIVQHALPSFASSVTTIDPLAFAFDFGATAPGVSLAETFFSADFAPNAEAGTRAATRTSTNRTRKRIASILSAILKSVKPPFGCTRPRDSRHRPPKRGYGSGDPVLRCGRICGAPRGAWRSGDVAGWGRHMGATAAPARRAALCGGAALTAAFAVLTGTAAGSRAQAKPTAFAPV